MRHGLAGILAAGALVVASVAGHPAARADVLTLTSSALKDNDQLAVKNACSDKQRSPNCVGENISPPLAWSGAPDTTKSYALIMIDPEGRAPAGVNHMVIYGIPAEVKGFAEGDLSKESDKFIGGKSTMEKATYWGPGTPPNTDWHHYTFILMATDLDAKDPALKPGMTRDELAVALKDHVKASAGLVTRFKHP
ncbi:MAG: YbhB/YbcL family Raf kinase inhibitor-like protein [Alphaproteobacteria bacterium]|nr:YbhB/YbcL family Raf kinase inhibitor-like protein [Alphaproteobacteria bacterium]MBV9555213.1 YbhB/YbcL family Raf kinase inhibitor-like protein [Alphaproteobacteria bacterium]